MEVVFFLFVGVPSSGFWHHPKQSGPHSIVSTAPRRPHTRLGQRFAEEMQRSGGRQHRTCARQEPGCEHGGVSKGLDCRGQTAEGQVIKAISPSVGNKDALGQTNGA